MAISTREKRMARGREVLVHLVCDAVKPERLIDGVAVVVDVLRATTTIVHALAAGCVAVRPCAGVEEAQKLAGEMRVGHVLLAGERDGLPLPGFDLGNSPKSFTPARCRGQTLVLTTTNGTRALLCCQQAARILIAAFVNYSAVCEQLRLDPRPIHIVCAGHAGDVALEDTLLAGAIVDFLCEHMDVELNDGARVAWDCFENHGRVLEGALEVSAGGVLLASLGYDEDVRAAARVDQFALAPEVLRDPLRVELGVVGITKSYWVK
jgi:2-phosphosulfolactate phosphatase